MNRYPIIFRIRALAVVAVWTTTLATPTLAQESVTTFDVWESAGGELVTTAETKAVTIPAGAQIYQSVSAESVELKMVSRPVFGDKPSEWSVVEMGPASLTFVRGEEGGGMVLLADEPLELPFAIPLSESGRSEELLDLSLYYDQSAHVAVLTIAGVEFDIAATAPAGAIMVAVSTGASNDWELDSLAVTDGADRKVVVPPSVRPGANPSPPRRDSPASERPLVALSGNRADIRRQAVADSRALFAQDKDVEAEKALTDANRNPRNTAEWHLESANALVQLSYLMMREGQVAKAAELAARALEHTELASRKALRLDNRLALVAAADETVAFIQERLLGDYAAARASYQRAAMRHPLGDAQRAVRRLQAIEGELQRKSAASVGKEKEQR